jgi:hypothetical protein
VLVYIDNEAMVGYAITEEGHMFVIPELNPQVLRYRIVVLPYLWTDPDAKEDY